VFRQEQGAFGIWIDYANQGIRITGNVIYDTQAATVFLEMNHGPTLVDNNILIGEKVRSNSEATIFAHNLFVDCSYQYNPDTKRRSAYYTPHTTKTVGTKTGTAQDEMWFNNIFVRQGIDDVKDAPGFTSDYNIFLEGAKKSSFGDENSVTDPFVTGFIYKSHPLGVTIKLSMNDESSRLKAPWLDHELVGTFSTVRQTIEDRFGNPIRVDTDINGKKFAYPIAGPLADIQKGKNTFEWKLNPVQ
jgi:hypothetical protein